MSNKFILKDGDLFKDTSDAYPHDYVRKFFSHDIYGKKEKEIVTKIFNAQPLEGIVKIYNVTDSYYDQEFLTALGDTNLEQVNTTQLEEDIDKGLEELHALCIIYIDLHEENIGYSSIDSKFKIFDFNMSESVKVFENGTCDYTSWKSQPSQGLLLNEIERGISKELCEKYQNCKEIKKAYENELISAKSIGNIYKRVEGRIKKICLEDVEGCGKHFENLDKRLYDTYIKRELIKEIMKQQDFKVTEEIRDVINEILDSIN